jgi:hypothetical protein
MNTISKLLWEIAEIDPDARMWCDDIIAYHITKADNTDGIRSSGIIAKSCHQTQRERRPAVYFFVDADFDIQNVETLLGPVNEYAVITVKIPAEEIKNLDYDGLYNASFTFAFGAARINRSIPAEWIENVEIRKCEQ